MIKELLARIVIVATASLLLGAYIAYAEPLRVAILDTGLDLKDPRFSQVLCKTGHKAYNGDAMNDTEGHGTHVAGIIKQYAGDALYCLVIFKVFEDRGRTLATSNIISAIRDAVGQGASIINMSFGGYDYNEYERNIIAAAQAVTFVTAAGNDGQDLGGVFSYYPSSYALPNMRVVGALGAGGKRLRNSNYGGPVKYWEPGEIVSTLPNNYQGRRVGTSMAAAVKTGKLIKEIYAATHR